MSSSGYQSLPVGPGGCQPRLYVTGYQRLNRLKYAATLFAWLALAVFLFLPISNAVLYDAGSYYKASLLLPQAIVNGIAIGVTLTVGLGEMRLANVLSLLAMAMSFILFAREISRQSTCVDDTALPTSSIDLIICEDEPHAQWFMPFASGLLAVISLILSILLQEWIPERSFNLLQTRPQKLTASNPVTDTRRTSRSAALLDRAKRAAKKASVKFRQKRKGAVTIGVLAVVLCLVQLSATAVDLILPDTTALYRSSFHLVPAVFAGVCLGCLFTVGRGEVVFAIVSGFLALTSSVGGAFLEIWRMVECLGGTPRTPIEDEVCTGEPVLRWLNPIYYPVQAIIIIVMLVFLFPLLYALQKSR